MPTLFTHTAAALLGGAVVAGKNKMPRRFWLLTALAGTLPDLDVLGLRLGVPYHSLWGHRGLTHSLLGAALLGGSCAAVMVLGRSGRPWRRKLWWLVPYFFAITAGHGLLDSATNGGSGVAFFAPWDETRHFLPAQPIEVSPIGVRRLLSMRGVQVFASEFLWVWLPMTALVLARKLWPDKRSRASAEPRPQK